ncbi:MAG: alpha/beta fold hydrolase [Gammaproteobacteria bacterium]|nr:alpha/beta fold hydrolase [Gammaproteobacteria bacterium]
MNIKESPDKFNPSRWVPGGHAQTLWRKFAAVTAVNHARERIELKDGDFIDLDWNDQDNLQRGNNGMIVLILHGLCGCSKSSYVQSLQYKLGLLGIPSAAMNFRGCSGEVNRLAKAYHSGITEDLCEVFESISEQYSESRIALAGFSLGANVLLKWLGEAKLPDKVSKAVAVSTPFHLSNCSQAMLRGLSRYYGQYFLWRLVSVMEKKKAYFRKTENTEQLEILESFGNLRSLKSIWHFDEKVTAPLHGFAGAEDYYDKCSSMQFLTDIKTPTLLLQSNDDPIIPAHTLPQIHDMSDAIHIDLSESGGHVGFASASDRFWLEHRIIQFLTA